MSKDINGGSLDNFIVRIYRQKELNGELFGVVEETGEDGRKAFSTVSEMVSILTRGSKERRTGRRFKLALPVLVKCTSSLGHSFAEETLIEDISHNGAYFSVRDPLLRGDRLTLHLISAMYDHEIKASVVRCSEKSEVSGIGIIFE